MSSRTAHSLASVRSKACAGAACHVRTARTAKSSRTSPVASGRVATPVESNHLAMSRRSWACLITLLALRYSRTGRWACSRISGVGMLHSTQT